MNLLDGKLTSSKVKAEIAAKIASDVAGGKRAPGLAVILVGENPASQVYVRNKIKDCEEIGIISKPFILPENTPEDELISLVKRLNGDKTVDGILVQLPLPKSIDERKVIETISPSKDVDAFHPANVGRITLGLNGFAPCTPAGVMRLLAEYGISTDGKNCVVVGRSNIVGKPQAMLLLHKNATVTICHSKTKNIKEITKNADVLVAAVGRAQMFDGDYIKDGAVVIDVGMNRLENKKLVGDVDFESAEKKASYITPVPGGVGPMTIAMLMKNTLTAAKNAVLGK